MKTRPLLLPLNPGYRLGLLVREWRLRTGREQVRRLRWPVVSVGSLSAGGAGKTPMTIALAKALAARGCSVDVLSRGYGRLSDGAERVRLHGSAEQFGDEPLLIAQAGVPVYVARQRYDAGALAEADAEMGALDGGKPRVHLLDDGFQHRQLHRDVDILLASREDWRDRLLPAGNLREALRAAERADAIAIPAEELEFEQELRAWGWRGPVWRVRRAMEIPKIEGPVAAFCGIARPEQFFMGLEDGGLQLASRMVFPDHHRFSAGDLERITATAQASNATALVTTEKDRMRLGLSFDAAGSPCPLISAGLRLDLEEQAIRWTLEMLAR